MDGVAAITACAAGDIFSILLSRLPGMGAPIVVGVVLGAFIVGIPPPTGPFISPGLSKLIGRIPSFGEAALVLLLLVANHIPPIMLIIMIYK
jgi:hypothetical protein